MDTPPAVTVHCPEVGPAEMLSMETQTSSRFALAATLCAQVSEPAPVVVVELDRAQGFEPKLSSKRLPDGRMVTAPLEDMAPFLERDEFARHMIVPVTE